MRERRLKTTFAGCWPFWSRLPFVLSAGKIHWHFKTQKVHRLTPMNICIKKKKKKKTREKEKKKKNAVQGRAWERTADSRLSLWPKFAYYHVKWTRAKNPLPSKTTIFSKSKTKLTASVQKKVCKRVIMLLSRTQTKYNVQIKKRRKHCLIKQRKKKDIKATKKERKTTYMWVFYRLHQNVEWA